MENLIQQDVISLDEVRITRLTNVSGYAPVESLIGNHETVSRCVPIKHAGMIIRTVITEPRDTDIHNQRPSIIIKHGFMASRPAYDHYSEALASAGNRVVHYGMPRSSKLLRQYHPKNLQVLRTHSQALHGVSKYMQESYPDSPSRHNYIGHSMGGLALSHYLRYRPDMAENAIFLASAGLTKHTFLQMAARAGTAVIDEIYPFVRDASNDQRLKLGVHSAWHILRNPLLLIREGYQAATDMALDSIEGARRDGVRVGAIWMANDTFFPLHEIDSSVTATFNTTQVVKGNHLKPQDFPRQAAWDALNMLSALETTVESTVANTTA